MPFVRCVYSGDIGVKDDITVAISSASAAALGKPEAVMMVQVIHDESLFFAGSKEPCAMVQIQAIGGSLEPLLTPLSEILTSVGGILPSRIFMNFQEFTSDNWSTHGVTVKQFYEHSHST